MATGTQFNAYSYIPQINPQSILQVSDLATVSAKKIRRALEGTLNVDLSQHKAEIDRVILECYQKIPGSTEDDKPIKCKINEESPPSGSITPRDNKIPSSQSPLKRRLLKNEEDDERLARELDIALNSSRRTTRRHFTSPKKTKTTKVKSKAKIHENDGENGSEIKKRKVVPNPNNPFNAPMILSPALGNLLGEKELSRPQVVKRIWDYIKEHNLQDPSDKRHIMCDDKLRDVFVSSRIHMFSMNKTISQHLYKKSEVTDTGTAMPFKAEVKENVKLEDDDSEHASSSQESDANESEEN
ncbi:Upstream activation factor subunit spp27 [Neolecta irregularis DAH-3]|uniref:Upstream activation factor subunit spp27 n=1 Tax=Neolecta irregularis (strain DAH-3) TaxID=1198029 RepID=A0A1U7LVZ3_NEOID|nr:Upstream activation factor subunit spp27 [Neolecta irregularis DAH-3]|eukprot:OLL26850.1 Upstream activation factor subunit spp27 [Neolecta irregularis DAH-3]